MSSHVVSHSTTPSALTAVQQQVALSLAGGLTITAAATAAGLHRTTIYKWLAAQQEFADAVRAARAEHILTVRDGMQDLSARALDTLQSLLDDPQTAPALRLRVALAVLNRPKFPRAGWGLPAATGVVDEEELRKDLLLMELDSQEKLDQATYDRAKSGM